MILEAIPTAVGEMLAHVLGKVSGRAFKLKEEQPQRSGAHTVFSASASAGAGVTITLIYP
jgi:hypothetical protein